MPSSFAVAIVGPDILSIREQLARAERLGDVAEFRVDLFQDVSVEDLKAIKDQCSLPVLVTLRSQRHGGQFSDEESARAVSLHHLSAIQPELLDIELGMPHSEVMELRRLLPHTRFVISMHDPVRLPSDLLDLYQQLQQYPGDSYKIAANAHDVVDALRLVAFVREMNRMGGRLTGVGMGTPGHLTRILAPVMGCPLWFASLDDASAAAPGQLPVQTLRDVFQVQRHGFDTQMLGLIGDPVSHSRGDVVLNALFAELSLPGVYVKMPLRPEALSAFFAEVRRIGWRGLSVTMPLKEAVIPHLDSVDSSAQAIGAVNTIVAGSNGLVGYNFDGVAALDAIEAVSSKAITGQTMVVVGAGGAAKAIIYEGKLRGMDVVVVNRTDARAASVAEALGVRSAPFNTLPDLLRQQPLVLAQATSVGQAPQAEMSLVESEDLQPETIVFDVVSVPAETVLLRQAKQRGCCVVGGREMWWRQALMQTQLWFGTQLPEPLLRTSILKILEGKP